MKILAVHNYYQVRSGEDLAFDATVDVLRKRGHEVRTVTFDNQEIRGGSLALGLRTLFSPRTFRRILRETRGWRPDVALVQNVFPLASPAAYVALRLRKIPVAQRIFNYRLVCPNGVLYTQGAICERCVKGAYWNAVRFKCHRGSRASSAALALSLGAWRLAGLWRWGVRRYFTPDKFLGNKILPAVGRLDRIRTVFNPAPTGAIGAAPFANRGKEILYVGRLTREKGIFTFLECARRMPDKGFTIVGKGEHEEEARRIGAEIPNVRFLGAVYGDALSQHLATCGALVLPSEWYDNMPLILTQAMLAAAPVVASRIDGIPEFVLEGETGRLAEPGDAGSFVEALGRVFAEPAVTRALAEEGARRAQGWFGPQAYGESLESLLTETANG